MVSLTTLYEITFGGAILAFIAQHTIKQLRTFIVIVTSALGVYIVWRLPSQATDISFRLGDFQILWGVNEYSQLFALLIAVLGFFTLIYSIDFMKERERLGYFYMNFLIVIGGMYGIVYSQDLISLFFFWEIMTWSSFMLVIYCCDDAQSIGLKYFVFSAIGAYAMLTAIVLIWANLETTSLSVLFENFTNLSSGLQITVIVLFIVGFGVKSAMMPFHVWAPDAYAISPTPFTALFSGALSKMGIWGLGIVLLKLAAQSGFYVWVQDIVAWIGAITALLATFYAIVQTDAKKLLAYSSIGQLGYIIVGLAIGTPLSIMSALFLAMLHGIFKAMLFMSAGAVFYRTGSTDMNEVTGLIRKMPWTFLTALFGIITVAGVPPLGGFAAKWMLYEATIQSGHYFLVIVLFAASTAAFLYLYRFIFSLFLGQEEKEYADIKEAPLTMTVPMVIMALFTLVVGVFPGIFINPIGNAMGYFGNYTFNWDVSSLLNEWGNHVDMMTVVMTIGAIFIIAAIFITIKNYRTTRYVTTKDIHTSGEIPTENENLTYAVDFYKPFERAIAPVLKRSIDKTYNLIAENLESAFDFLRYVYTGNGQTYALYVVLFLAVLMVFAELIFGIQL
ncbi:MAG: hypothetical protein GXO87_00995 [Chlorobi bacterium]|nr:hypothetical protein [Chlorobiota bacterium]